MEFLEAKGRRTLLFDGAMGTMLLKSGLLRAGECTELLNLTRPLDVMDIHISYLRAGADVITANTFGANPLRLAAFDAAPRMAEIMQSGVALCREAITSVAQETNRRAYVAASIGPTGLLPGSSPDMPRRMFEAYQAQCAAAADAGADMLIIETMSDMAEARLALLAARAACCLPVLTCFTLEPDDSTFAGNPPEVLSLCCAKLGASMAGVNCGLGPKELFQGFSRLSGSCTLPVLALPNAGLPLPDHSYPFSPDAFALAMLPYLQAGAQGVGGCCGTLPAHIAALRSLLADTQGCARTPVQTDAFLCSSHERRPLEGIEQRKPLHLSGLSPADALRAIASAAEGQSALALDLGTLSPDAIRLLLWEALPLLTHTALCLHVYSAQQAEAALFLYPGIAAVQAKSDAYRVLKSAVRYGAEVLP